VVKGAATMEIVILVVAILALDIAAQLYATDSRPAEPERRRL
jgi:hypothetical protein